MMARTAYRNLRIGDRISVEADRIYRYWSFPSDLSAARIRGPAARMSPPRQGDDRFQAGMR
jgi:hypothetical protein